MKRFAVATLWLVLAASAFAGKYDHDEQSIKNMTEKFAAAWNLHDAKTMAAFWSEDATLTNPHGRLVNGRSEIEKLFTEDQSGWAKTSQIQLQATNFRWAKADVAFVDYDVNITGVKDSAGKEKALPSTRMAALWMRKNKHWWLTDCRAYFLEKSSDQAMENRQANSENEKAPTDAN